MSIEKAIATLFLLAIMIFIGLLAMRQTEAAIAFAVGLIFTVLPSIALSR